MSGCNATIEVGCETLTCVNGGRACLVHRHDAPWVQWTDELPGATPHEDPTPSYRAVPRSGSFDGAWDVDGGGALSAATFWVAHPDPEGAAKAEAARLTLGRDDIVLHVAEVANERDEARSERDRYRKALSKILPAGTGFGLTRDEMQRLARRVLDGGDA